MECSSRESYRFPATLSSVKRWFGLPIDEFVVYTPLGFLAIFSTPQIFIPVLIFSIIGFKKLKNGKGSTYLLHVIYWFLPKFVSDFFIGGLPPSNYRKWIC